RVLVGTRGDWGRHLPLVDDLLSTTALVSSRPTVVFGPLGRTHIVPPGSLFARITARMKLTLSYARFADQRRRALESTEPQVQKSLADLVEQSTGIRLRFEPHDFASSLEPPAELPAPAPIAPPSTIPRAAASVALMFAGSSPLAPIVDLASDLAHYT